MSWVLVLIQPVVGAMPAVIGGYERRSEAEEAGDLATSIPVDCNVSPPPFHAYVVIPGSAYTGPLGTTHCKMSYEVKYSGDGAAKRIVTRSFQRFP